MAPAEGAGRQRTDSRTILRWPATGALLLAFAAATFTQTDADLWGHLRFGLDTLRSWTLPRQDPYSFTQDTPWINHEWLSELQMAVAWRLGGTPGLVALKGALTLGTFLLVWSSLRGVRLSARILILAVLAFGTVHMTSSVRPQLWTFLFFAILCRALASDTTRARRWLPVLFAAWANHHGGWIVGLGVLGVWAAAEVLVDRRSIREWALLLLTCVLGTLATPYGWILWDFVLRTVRVERAISEWQPLWTTHWLNWLPWVIAVVTAGWAVRRSGPHRLAIAGVLSVLAYGSLRVLRIESLFIEATPLLLAPWFRVWWPAQNRPLQRTSAAAEWIVAATAFGLTATGAVWLLSSTLRCLPTLTHRAADRQAVSWLKTAQPGRLVTYFDWGEYALWHLHPRLLVSMDGRRETIYSDRRIAEHDAIVDGTPAGFQTLAEWRAEYVWLPATSVAAREWLASNGYRIDVQSPRSFVAVRQDLPPLTPHTQAAPSRACFPE